MSIRGAVRGEQYTEGFFIFKRRVHEGIKPSVFTTSLGYKTDNSLHLTLNKSLCHQQYISYQRYIILSNSSSSPPLPGAIHAQKK